MNEERIAQVVRDVVYDIVDDALQDAVYDTLGITEVVDLFLTDDELDDDAVYGQVVEGVRELLAGVRSYTLGAM